MGHYYGAKKRGRRKSKKEQSPSSGHSGRCLRKREIEQKKRRGTKQLYQEDMRPQMKIEEQRLKQSQLWPLWAQIAERRESQKERGRRKSEKGQRDNVVWDEEQETEARKKTREQFAFPASAEDQEKYYRDANEYWNKFYCIHENKFFKDRQWLFIEFPELAPAAYLSPGRIAELQSNATKTSTSGEELSLGGGKLEEQTAGQNQNSSNSSKPCDSELREGVEQNLTTATDNVSCESRLGDGVGDLRSSEGNCAGTIKASGDFPGKDAKFRIWEVGCGVGNSVFPILQANNDPDLMVYCCDFSSTAFQLVKENKDYNCGRCHAFVCDVSDPDSTVPFPEESLDVIILIFVLIAIQPEKFQSVIIHLASFFKPCGVILFRDYGRYDIAQLRFKKGRCLSENFYARGDGTRVYFFTQDEMRELMANAGLVEKQNLVDCRLQVNRGRQLKMYRVWIQCKYVKPGSDAEQDIGDNKATDS